MKLTILVDDSKGDMSSLLAEHGLCFYIEDQNSKVLFDTGYSSAFIKNAAILGVDLLDIDYIVLSHGHYDHTWGLASYYKLLTSAIKSGKVIKKPTILTHPDTFLEKFEDGRGEIGCMITEDKLNKNFNVVKTKAPYQLTPNLFFLGEVPRSNDFEAKEPIAKVFRDSSYQDDFIVEDSALAYKSNNGVSIITGCSHSGICNIIEHAKNTFKVDKVSTVIGGFHLIDEPKEKLDKVGNYLKNQDIKRLCPCHCTDLKAKDYLDNQIGIDNVKVGYSLLI